MRAALILMPVLMLAGCNIAGGHDRDDNGDHRQIRRDFQVAGAFDRISLGGSPDVVVTVGGAPSIRAEGDASLIDRLEITAKDGDLHIGYKKHDGWSWSGNNRHVTIYVSAPALSGAAIAGSGDMRIDKVQGDSFSGSIGGSGDLQVGALKVASATLSIAGSGGIRAAGAADKTTISVAGSGGVDGSALQSRNATISIVGSGDVQAHASEAADVSIMGSGDVTVTGGAKCNVHRMGSGDARCA